MLANTRAVIKYRLDSATERLEAAKLMIARDYYGDSVCNTYFSMFDGVRALLAAEKSNSETFLSAIRHFRRKYIETGLLDRKFSSYFDAAFKIRYAYDYGDFVIVSREQAEAQYQHAVEFLEAVKDFLEEAEHVCEDTGGDELPAADD